MADLNGKKFILLVKNKSCSIIKIKILKGYSVKFLSFYI